MILQPIRMSGMPENSRQPIRPPSLPAAARWSALASACLLAACSTTQLPPWPASGQTTRPQSAAAATQPAAPSGVTSTPIAPQMSNLGGNGAPYGEAVARRFPDPAVRYDTPGLAEQRRQFTTNAELSGWLRKIASSSNSQTRLGVAPVGLSQRALPIEALVATRAASIQAAAVNATGLPTVVLVGQQHGDEPASAEALLVIARELAPGGLLEPLLQQINIVVVPRANPDGSDSGTHGTANGTDLAHDHLQLSTPEARALAVLVRDYRPIAVIDLHEFPAGGNVLRKFGGVQSSDVLLQYGNTANTHDIVLKAEREWYDAAVRDALTQAGLGSDGYFQTSANPQDRSISSGSAAPDTLRSASALKNAVGLAITSRGSDLGRAHLQRRVHSLVIAATRTLRASAERAKDLSQIRSFVARDIASQACRRQLVVKAEPALQQRSISLLDPKSGEELAQTLDFSSALDLKPVLTRSRPCGYWLSAHSTEAVQRLRQLGLQVMRVAEPGKLIADSYNDAKPIGATERGSLLLTRGAIEADEGSFYVSLNQSHANLAAAALEPDTPYSFAGTGVLAGLSDVARIVNPPSVVFEDDDAD